MRHAMTLHLARLGPRARDAVRARIERNCGLLLCSERGLPVDCDAAPTEIEIVVYAAGECDSSPGSRRP
jgi:hypothetical protein